MALWLAGIRDASGHIAVGRYFYRDACIYPAQVTLYEKMGDWILLISGLVSVMLGVQFCLPRPCLIIVTVLPFLLLSRFTMKRIICPAHREIDAMLRALEQTAEIILVDDAARTPRPAVRQPAFLIRWLHLDRNSGQSAAVLTYSGGRGNTSSWMDADLQNDRWTLPKCGTSFTRKA